MEKKSTSGTKTKPPELPGLRLSESGFAGPPFSSGVVGDAPVPSTPELEELLRELLPASAVVPLNPRPPSSIEQLLGLDLSLGAGDGECYSDGGTGDGVEMFSESLPTLEFFFESSEVSSASSVGLNERDVGVPKVLVSTATATTVTPAVSPVQPEAFGDIFALETELVRMMEDGEEEEEDEPVSAGPVPLKLKLKAAAQAQRALRSVGFKPRRRKTAVPATKKTDFYFDKRRRNNISAAKNRLKVQRLRGAKKFQHQAVVTKNAALRLEVAMLERTLSALQAAALERLIFPKTLASL